MILNISNVVNNEGYHKYKIYHLCMREHIPRMGRAFHHVPCFASRGGTPLHCKRYFPYESLWTRSPPTETTHPASHPPGSTPWSTRQRRLAAHDSSSWGLVPMRGVYQHATDLSSARGWEHGCRRTHIYTNLPRPYRAGCPVGFAWTFRQRELGWQYEGNTCHTTGSR